MSGRIKVVAMTAAIFGLLFVSAATAAPGTRGGPRYSVRHSGFNSGYGGYGYGGYGFGSGYGYGGYGYGGGYGGYGYGRGFPSYARYNASRAGSAKYPSYPRGYFENYQSYYGGNASSYTGGPNHSSVPLVIYTPPPPVYLPPPPEPTPPETKISATFELKITGTPPAKKDAAPETKVTASLEMKASGPTPATKIPDKKVSDTKVPASGASKIQNTVPEPIVPEPPVPEKPVFTGTIKLRLPPTADTTVKYEINGMAYVLKPGHVQTFANDRNWTITFDDGTGHMESQPLPAGKFVFERNAESRWQLKEF